MTEQSASLAELAAGRWPAVRQVVGWLRPGGRPMAEPAARIVAAYADLARVLLVLVPTDDPQLVHALQRLLDSKDAAVRAALVAHGLVEWAEAAPAPAQRRPPHP